MAGKSEIRNPKSEIPKGLGGNSKLKTENSKLDSGGEVGGNSKLRIEN
jgi:hypothetical protein